MKREDAYQLLVDGNRGIYVPLAFVTRYNYQDWGVSQEDLDTISNGPEDEHYWDAWDNILDTAKYKDKTTGEEFTLEQDGDLFAVNTKYEGDETD